MTPRVVSGFATDFADDTDLKKFVCLRVIKWFQSYGFLKPPNNTKAHERRKNTNQICVSPRKSAAKARP